MKKKLVVLPMLMLIFVATAYCQNPEETEVWNPEPRVVKAGNSDIEAPADAIILFDGTSFDEWESQNGGDVEWTLTEDFMTVNPGTGGIKTRKTFEDFQLHIEWSAPTEIDGDGQGRGNSGIFLQGRYEVQVLDNWNNRTYSNGMAGSIYKQHIPLANPAKQPGEWQKYDIFYKAPRFKDNGDVEEPARVTVILNGVLIQNNVEIYGPTEYIGEPSYEAHGPDSIHLQDHSNLVRFRNIWIRELDQEIVNSDGIHGDQ